jgi:hypothetical protein
MGLKSIIPALGSLRQEHWECKVSLGYTGDPISKKKKKSLQKPNCH